MKLKTLEDALTEELQDLYDAEKRLVKGLPKMAKSASFSDLKTALESHLEETKTHVTRLEEGFQTIGKSAKAKTCEAMKGLIAEGEEAVQASGDDNVCDALLIGAAQRVEHYEMAAYGTARAMAEACGHSQLAKLLQQTLDEEGAADKKLTKIAKKVMSNVAVTA